MCRRQVAWHLEPCDVIRDHCRVAIVSDIEMAMRNRTKDHKVAILSLNKTGMIFESSQIFSTSFEILVSSEDSSRACYVSIPGRALAQPQGRVKLHHPLQSSATRVPILRLSYNQRQPSVAVNAHATVTARRRQSRLLRPAHAPPLLASEHDSASSARLSFMIP